MKYCKCLTLLPCYDWTKKWYINTFWPDLLTISCPYAFRFYCKLICKFKFTFKVSFHKSLSQKLGYLTDYAVNYQVTLHLELVYLIWVHFCCILSLQFPPLTIPNYWLQYSIYSSALQTSEQMQNTECATNSRSPLVAFIYAQIQIKELTDYRDRYNKF